MKDYIRAGYRLVDCVEILNVVLDDCQPRIILKMDQMFRPPGTEVVVDHYALGDTIKQPRCQMTADKPRATRNEYVSHASWNMVSKGNCSMWDGEYLFLLEDLILKD